MGAEGAQGPLLSAPGTSPWKEEGDEEKSRERGRTRGGANRKGKEDEPLQAFHSAGVTGHINYGLIRASQSRDLCTELRP